jgi:hypothetical protein
MFVLVVNGFCAKLARSQHRPDTANCWAVAKSRRVPATGPTTTSTSNRVQRSRRRTYVRGNKFTGPMVASNLSLQVGGCGGCTIARMATGKDAGTADSADSEDRTGDAPASPSWTLCMFGEEGGSGLKRVSIRPNETTVAAPRLVLLCVQLSRVSDRHWHKDTAARTVGDKGGYLFKVGCLETTVCP